LKIVEVVKADEVEIEHFYLRDFTTQVNIIKSKENIVKTISKKELKYLAEKLNLDYNDEQIEFAKKIIKAYLAQR
jgi:hydroxylamine reductase (hybrid-cluster protein)